ncbi:MAG: response regulator [Dehalococcoidia bacterium]|nr:response regulator [Dehalococcoidia bacterium]
MRILLVEDDEASIRRFMDRLGAEPFAGEIDVSTARTLEAAREIVRAVDFDFAVCDLHIPRDAGKEPRLDHGIAVYQLVASTQPGTPTMLMTGSGDERRARQLVAERPPADIFGVNEPYPMSDFVFKDELDDCMQRIGDIALQLDALDAIELVTESSEDWPDPLQARALRIFARRNGARRVEIRPLGGLSDAAAVRASIFQDDADPIASVFAKLGPLDALDDEARRYHEAALRLPAGAYAPLLDRVEAGAGRIGGLFYGLAEQHQTSLFEWLERNPEDAVATIDRLREVLGTWRGKEDTEEVLVTSLRRERIGGGELGEHAPALDAASRSFEKRSVEVRRTLQHGDLHGENVLVAESGAPLLIDFANVAPMPAAFDPVVLELSLVFQAGSPFLDHDWPSAEQCERWADLQSYLEGCPVPGLIRACRRWAMDAALSPAAVYAVAYAEALRQLAYSPRDPALALGIARSAAREGLRLTGGEEDGGRPSDSDR